MSFDLLKNARRNIGLRLGLWYAFVFAVSSVALLMIAYYLLAAAVSQQGPGGAVGAAAGVCRRLR